MPHIDIVSNKASLHLQSDQKQCCALVANLVTWMVEIAVKITVPPNVAG